MELRPEQLRGGLVFRDVSFAYPTRRDAPIFQHLDLEVPAGSVMAVVGSSGTGKSTLVALLLRLYDSDSGEALGAASSLKRLHGQQQSHADESMSSGSAGRDTLVTEHTSVRLVLRHLTATHPVNMRATSQKPRTAVNVSVE